jgi:hypothetical protein
MSTWKLGMTNAAQNIITAFDELSPREQHAVAVEVLRRSSADGELSERALHMMADELFLQYEAEETPRDDSA